MEQQITRDFTVTRATVHYPDGTDENIEYVEGFVHDGVFEAYDIDKEDWSAYCGYYSNEPTLTYDTGPDNRFIFSNENYQKIETNWTEELTAVADVNLSTERRGLLRRKKYEVIDEEVDVTIWQRHEWEAHEE